MVGYIIEDVKQAGYRLEEGFSGAPVWDETLQGVAGMAVAAEKQRPEAKAAFIIPANVLIEAWDVLKAEAISACPYRGLFAFREEDARFFFGREKFTQKLVAVVESQPLVAVIGASGSGKSSAVFAGLIPQLRGEQEWAILTFRPGNRPFDSLAAKLIPWLETGMSETDRLVEVKKLARKLQTREVWLSEVLQRILEKHPQHRLLLVADQFEELYTYDPPNPLSKGASEVPPLRRGARGGIRLRHATANVKYFWSNCWRRCANGGR